MIKMDDFTVLSNGVFNPTSNINQQPYHHKDHMLATESSQENHFTYGISTKSEVSALKNDYSIFTNYIQQSALLERSVDPALDNSCLGSICGDLKFSSDCTPSNISLNEIPFKNASPVTIEAKTTLPKVGTCIVSGNANNGNNYSKLLNPQATPSFPSIMFHKDGTLNSVNIESKSMQNCKTLENFLNLKSNSTNEQPRNSNFLHNSSAITTSCDTGILGFTLYGSSNNKCNLIKENSDSAVHINYLNECEDLGNGVNNPTTSIDPSNQQNNKDNTGVTLRRSTENEVTRSTAEEPSLFNNEDVVNNSPSILTVRKIIKSSKMTVKDDNLSHNVSVQSSNCDSLSSDELIDLDNNECGTGYQDTTSSHSQQSAGGGAGAGIGGGGGGPGSNSGVGTNASNSSVVLLNGVGQPHNGGGGGYMSLIPPTMGACSSSGHMGGISSGTSGSAGSAGEGGGSGIDFKHLFEELCPVCGDKVSGYHYGLLTCESCKGFFKRTVQNKKVYTCVAERSCHIDKTQRKRCPYCRFQKCLEVGMKLEAVRADRMRGGRNKFGPMYKRDRARKLQVMRQRQLALQALRTSIGSTDMKSTPLSPGYQQAYSNMNIKQEIQIPQVSSLTQSPDSSPSPIAIALGQVTASTSVISNPLNGNTGSNSNNTSMTSDSINRSGSSSCNDAGSGSIQTTADSKLCFESGTHPSSTADTVIETLRVSPMIRDFVQSIDDREWQTQLFALLQKQTYNQVEVDLFELMCKVLDQNLFSQVDWARNTVFFKDLKVDDQMKLLQHSWSDMLVLDHLHQRIHNGLPDETQLNNGQVFNLLGLGLLGVPQLADYFNELQNKLQELKFDMGDYVCMKFLILLNPDVRGILNKKTVLEGHENVQAALLDYTLTCYPSVTDKFRRLLNILPDIHAMAARGEEHLYSKHCAGSAPTQTLLMEMLHAKRKV